MDKFLLDQLLYASKQFAKSRYIRFNQPVGRPINAFVNR